ncbi:MAG TPA: CDC48 family AAA ATPase [Candidatus Binatia bacterium]|jgi:transitional endoplasmic reticulum ATPase|nr:CDC48 family AAA ATPase [Candidatus Binatia bacterium]
MTTEQQDTSGEEKRLSLKVAEALGKDAGRGLARMDPADMEKLGVQVGEVIAIQGKRRTVAKAMPAFREARGQGLIQMDGIIRANARVGLDEKVEVTAATCQPATRVTLTPVGDSSFLSQNNDLAYVGRLLEGLPVVTGDRVRAILVGSRSQDFTVVSTTPEDIVIFQPTTLIRMQEGKGEKGKEERISYEDIGGLGTAVQKIREMVELPLRYPQIFDKLGIDPPKGVLLHGPPGTGKTLLARAVANETEAYFTHLSGPEVMGKFYGESEARLRAVFEDAQRHAPSILFIDEIDAIAPKREEMGGEKQVERRVVAQLLALMDGLEGRGKVIVIAATNLPNLLDPALRRPGRFDREIEIGIPDARARLEILEIHTRGMPLAEDVQLPRLSEVTHGFTGADLAALTREAAMTALRRIMPRINFAEELPYELLLDLKVTMSDFFAALKEVEPSAIREVFVEVPNVRWQDVGGLQDLKQQLTEAVEWPLKHAALFQQAGMRPPKGILLSGPPGTGKTLLVKALASETEVNFISVKGPELLSKYIGESERGVREIFKKARQAAPTILFLDEIDSLAPARGWGGDAHVTERLVSQLLTEMDGIEELKGVLVVAATNRPELIDPAVRRPGRFDLHLELPLPDADSRLEILKVHTRNRPVEKELDLSQLAEQTEGLTGADLESLCNHATLLAIREFLTQAQKEQGADALVIRVYHFQRALEEMTKAPQEAA